MTPPATAQKNPQHEDEGEKYPLWISNSLGWMKQGVICCEGRVGSGATQAENGWKAVTLRPNE